MQVSQLDKFLGPAPGSTSSNPFDPLQSHYQEPSADFMRKVTNEERTQHVRELAKEIHKCEGRLGRLKREAKTREENLTEAKKREPKSDEGGAAGEEAEGSEGDWTTVSKKRQR